MFGRRFNKNINRRLSWRSKISDILFVFVIVVVVAAAVVAAEKNIILLYTCINDLGLVNEWVSHWTNEWVDELASEFSLDIVITRNAAE